MIKTVTIAEAAASLSERLDIEPPNVEGLPCCFGKTVEGAPLEHDSQGPRLPIFAHAKDGDSSPEFRLSISRALRVPVLMKHLLQAVTAGSLRVRDSDGLDLQEDREGYASSLVNIAEAQAALESMGASFVGGMLESLQAPSVVAERGEHAASSKQGDGESIRRNRLYEEIEIIDGFELMTSAKIVALLRDVAGATKSCVTEVKRDSIMWVDKKGGKQETLFSALEKWLQRHQSRQAKRT